MPAENTCTSNDFDTYVRATQVPHITESFGATADAGDNEESIPVCTLKDHPHKAEHCVWWARDVFEDLFARRSDRLRGALVAACAPGGIRQWVRSQSFGPSRLLDAATDMDARFSVSRNRCPSVPVK